MSTNSWYFLHKAGEHAIQTQMFLAFLKDTKVLIDGKESNLYDAYELDSNGKIKLKDGVKLPGKLTKNGKVSLFVQNRIHALNKRINGVYNEFDQPELKRHWYGSLLFIYRDYLVPGYKRRYKKLTVDQKKEEAKSPEEAIFNSKKFGKKLNKHRVENYLFKRSKIK